MYLLFINIFNLISLRRYTTRVGVSVSSQVSVTPLIEVDSKCCFCNLIFDGADCRPVCTNFKAFVTNDVGTYALKLMTSGFVLAVGENISLAHLSRNREPLVLVQSCAMVKKLKTL